MCNIIAYRYTYTSQCSKHSHVVDNSFFSHEYFIQTTSNLLCHSEMKTIVLCGIRLNKAGFLVALARTDSTMIHCRRLILEPQLYTMMTNELNVSTSY